jgi:CubicO group peptidase (beta-lactamase class C family)
MRALVLALFVAACSGGSSRPTAPISGERAIEPALATRLDAVIDKAIAEQQAVGIVAMVARDGKIVYARAAGLADREAKIAAREDTVFRLASMTKPIVSVAALALIDQGKLSLDDAVTKYLPAFRPKTADGKEPVITVRHLLTHTSGLGYGFINPQYREAGVSDGLAEPGRTAEENLAKLAAVPLLFEPGAKWHYGLSIDVLGEVVAKAGGGTLPEVVARLITQPLAMTDTAFTADQARLAWPYVAAKPPARMTEPHEAVEGDIRITFSPARIFDPRSFPSGGAGMAGTAADYVRFLEGVRTGVVTKQPFAQNQIGDIDGNFLGPGTRFGFGFGVITDAAAAKTERGIGTYSWGGVYGTGFWVDPSAKLSVVIMTNTAGQTSLESDFSKAVYATPSSP